MQEETEIINNYRKRNVLIIYFIILFLALLNFLIIIFASMLINSSGFFSDIGLIIYTLFSKSCHQLKEKTFFIFGNYLPVCSRCFSIYSGFLFGCIIFPFIRRDNFFSFPKIWIFLLAVFLIVIDAGLHLVGLFDNSFLTRIFTGGFIGFISAFFIIPGFVNAYFEIVMFYKKKKISINDSSAKKY